MASQYALQLKASLDTTQVQQELKRLRAAQSQASQEMGGVRGTPVGSAHMQKIEVQLTKLNTTISGLQHAIEHLQKAQVHTAQQANIPQHASGLTYLPPGMTRTQFNSWMGSEEYAQLNQRVTKLIKSQNLVKDGYAKIGGMSYNIDDPYLAHKLWGTGKLKQFGKDFSKTNYQDQMTNWNQINSQQKNLADQRRRFQQGREFAGLIGGQLLGGAGEIATNMGFNNVGSVLTATGQGVTAGAGAAMASSMMGLSTKAAGWIGAVVGLVSTLSDLRQQAIQFGDSVQKATKALENNYTVIAARTSELQRSMQGHRNADMAENLLENKNLNEAKAQAEKWGASYTIAKSTYFSMEDPAKEIERLKALADKRKRAVDNAKNSSGLLSFAESWFGNAVTAGLGGKSTEDMKQDVKNRIDAETQEKIAAYQDQYKKAESAMQYAKQQRDLFKGVEKQLQADVDREKAEKEAKDKAEADSKKQLLERNDENIARFSAQGSANQIQDFVNGILGNKATSPLEKFNEIVTKLDEARTTKNTYLNQAFGISKDLKENSASMTSEQIREKMNEQAKLERDASYVEQRIGILETALGNIDTNTVAPDLSHVTSLAQYGFNMGEKDNTVERMDKYYTKSINLQQQIKDKIEQGIKTEAIYN